MTNPTTERKTWTVRCNPLLGGGTQDNAVRTPKQIVSSGITAIAGGGNHSLFLKSDGSLWAMGQNSYGQLGDGTFSTSSPTNLPEQIVSSGVIAIAAGHSHSLFLKSGGSLLAMGYNEFGQLGNGTTNSIPTPEQIVSSGVSAIAAGFFHSLFLKSDGSLWSMGWNLYGQLGDGAGGTFNSCTNRPQQIVGSGVVAIAAGAGHSLLLKSDGSLWAMGDNEVGQLGDGSLNSTNRPEQIVPGGVVAIAGGGSHSLFLKSDGSLWAMGWNYSGELGDGFTNRDSSLLPEQIFPPPQPVLTSGLSSPSNLHLEAVCRFGGTFHLLTTTNPLQPLDQWTPIWTHPINNRTNNLLTATLTNAVNSSAGQRFYILQSP